MIYDISYSLIITHISIADIATSIMDELSNLSISTTMILYSLYMLI